MSLTPVPTEQADDGPGPNMRRIGAYGALVAGGALVVGGVYSSLKVNSINNDKVMTDYRETVAAGEDICDAADRDNSADSANVRDNCSTASKFQTLQLVFYGLGIVSLGAGTYLLATDEPEEKGNATASRVEIIPSADHTGGGLDLRVTF